MQYITACLYRHPSNAFLFTAVRSYEKSSYFKELVKSIRLINARTVMLKSNNILQYSDLKKIFIMEHL